MEDDDEDRGGYEVKFQDAHAPAPSNLLEAEVVEDDEDDADYEEPRPRKRKKKKKKRRSGPGMSLEMSNFLITMGILAFLWIGLTALVFFAPDTTLFVLLIGFVIGSIGQSWFMRMAWDDGIQVALMCMFIPFYSWIYLIGNFERAGKPFAVRFFGGLILVSAIISMLASHGCSALRHGDYYEPGIHEIDPDDDEPDNDMEEGPMRRPPPQGKMKLKTHGRPQQP